MAEACSSDGREMLERREECSSMIEDGRGMLHRWPRHARATGKKCSSMLEHGRGMLEHARGWPRHAPSLAEACSSDGRCTLDRWHDRAMTESCSSDGREMLEARSSDGREMADREMLGRARAMAEATGEKCSRNARAMAEKCSSDGREMLERRPRNSRGTLDQWPSQSLRDGREMLESCSSGGSGANGESGLGHQNTSQRLIKFPRKFFCTPPQPF